jgi:hypothetical protein
MFHGLGIVSVVMAVSRDLGGHDRQLTRARQAYTGVIISAFKPQRPAILASPDTVWQAVTATQADYIFVVPVIAEVGTSWLYVDASHSFF